MCASSKFSFDFLLVVSLLSRKFRAFVFLDTSIFTLQTVSMMVLPRLKHEGEFLKACSDNIEERIRVHEADSDANKKAAADKKAVEQIKERLVVSS